MWSAGALAGAAPAEPAAAAPEVSAAVISPAAQTPPVVMPLTITVPGDVPAGALSAPAAVQTTGTVIPLPPGVYVGLVGLASAAIARRRYMKRR